MGVYTPWDISWDPMGCPLWNINIPWAEQDTVKIQTDPSGEVGSFSAHLELSLM